MVDIRREGRNQRDQLTRRDTGTPDQVRPETEAGTPEGRRHVAPEESMLVKHLVA